VRIRWNAQGPNANARVDLLTVLVNNRTSRGLFYDVRFAATGGPLVNLAPSGEADVEILLSNNAEPSSS
jgi:hypothetical protein